MTQPSFASVECKIKKKITSRERFLNEMEQVVPWDFFGGFDLSSSRIMHEKRELAAVCCLGVGPLPALSRLS